MNENTFRMLDFDQIKSELTGYAVTEMVKAKIDALEIHTDIHLIKRHLNETSEARMILDQANSVPLHALIGIKGLMDKLNRHEVYRAPEIEQISGFIKDAAKIKRFMINYESTAPKVAGYAQDISALEPLYETLSRCVAAGRVDDQASGTLQKIRKKKDIIEDKIKSKLQDYLVNSQYANMVSDAIISQRDGRYVIPIKSEHKRNFDGLVLDKSRSGGTFFVEPAAVKKLSDELSQLKIDEENEVYRILSELTNNIADYKVNLYLNYEILEHYDFLFAKAKLSRKLQGIEAEVNLSRRLQIVEGRNPILNMSAVPMNVTLTDAQRNLVITGPNTGGKTVTMKTIGLLCLMTQAGLHIPAREGTSLPIFKKILCDIGDGQSLLQNLSTFSSHIKNIMHILEETDEETLVILDEIGAGTDPSEGTGIGVAVLEALNQKRAFILASTHYNEIKIFAKDHPDFTNGSMAFDLKTLSPLYRLEVGKSGESNALNIALRIGLPPEIIKRAFEVAYKDKEVDQAFLTSDHCEGSVDELSSDSTQTDLHLKDVKAEAEIPDFVPPKDVSPFAPKPKSIYKVGDGVWVHTMKKNGVVCEAENAKGDVGVIVLGKKIKVNHKRLSPYIDSKELYPEAYDLNIVLESKENRKKDKLISKGKGQGIIIEKKGKD